MKIQDWRRKPNCKDYEETRTGKMLYFAPWKTFNQKNAFEKNSSSNILYAVMLRSRKQS